MSDDLIASLRALAAARPKDVSEVDYLWRVYAASCETEDLLRAENERLRDALRRIGAIETYSRRTWIMAVQAARKALEEN